MHFAVGVSGHNRVWSRATACQSGGGCCAGKTGTSCAARGEREVGADVANTGHDVNEVRLEEES